MISNVAGNDDDKEQFYSDKTQFHSETECAPTVFKHKKLLLQRHQWVHTVLIQLSTNPNMQLT